MWGVKTYTMGDRFPILYSFVVGPYPQERNSGIFKKKYGKDSKKVGKIKMAKKVSKGKPKAKETVEYEFEIEWPK